MRFYIHFLIALGHLIYKTNRGNGFPSLLLQALPFSLLCTQDCVLIPPTRSIVSASTTNQSNIALQGEHTVNAKLKDSYFPKQINTFNPPKIFLPLKTGENNLQPVYQTKDGDPFMILQCM